MSRIRAFPDRMRVALAVGALGCSIIMVFILWSASISTTLGRANFSPLSEGAIIQSNAGVENQEATPPPPAESLPAPVVALGESFKSIANLLPRPANAANTGESSTFGSLLSFNWVREKVSGAFGYLQEIVKWAVDALTQGGIVSRLMAIREQALSWLNNTVLDIVVSLRDYAYSHLTRTTEGE